MDTNGLKDFLSVTYPLDRCDRNFTVEIPESLTVGSTESLLHKMAVNQHSTDDTSDMAVDRDSNYGCQWTHRQQVFVYVVYD